VGHYARDCTEQVHKDKKENNKSKDKTGGKTAQFMMKQALTLQGTKHEYQHFKKSRDVGQP
jgi:hypothetical protein